MDKQIRRRFVKRLKGLTILVSCLSLIFPVSACKKNDSSQNDPNLLLGFSQIGSESAWRIGNTNDIEQQAENYGISLMFENANQKQENQIAAIRRFIAYKVDVIAFSPIVEDAGTMCLRKQKMPEFRLS